MLPAMRPAPPLTAILTGAVECRTGRPCEFAVRVMTLHEATSLTSNRRLTGEVQLSLYEVRSCAT
jgi:hypothetical protein